ncbi:MAG: hypothetical protein ABW182_04710 [Sphingomonas sp.]|uniref:hypothetical protein n=1 Tax=Sphingomonas rustica TaxID=3103142 RepID=UPI0031FC203E
MRGNHHRDHARRWKVGDKTYSVCTGCGRTMTRVYGDWRISREKLRPPVDA